MIYYRDIKIPNRISMTQNINTPLIWTIKGNLPVNELRYETGWEDAEDYLKFMENYYLGDELVKSSAHVYVKKALAVLGEQSVFS